MTTHIYLGSNQVGNIQIIHTDLDKIPRKGEMIGTTVENQFITAKINEVEWLIDNNEVNIFLK